MIFRAGGSINLDDDYFAAEQPIIDQLLAAGVFREVFGTPDIASTQTPQMPAALLMYDGDTIPGGDANRSTEGDLQLVQQRWVVFVIVPNIRLPERGRDARIAGGPLIRRVIRQISGFDPIGNGQTMFRIPGPRASYRQESAMFPVAFALPIFTQD
jgi:hypothetical protein